MLTKIKEEVERRDLSDVPTDKLLELLLKYNSQVKEEIVEELNKLWVFGITVTEEEAKENVKMWVKRVASNTANFLFFYAVGSWRQIMCEDEPEDAITYSAKENYTINRQVFTRIYPEDTE